MEGDEQAAAFERASNYLRNRVSLFPALPLESVDRMALQQRLRSIGREAGATSPATSAAP